MKEKVWSLSGDTFHITDSAGHEVVQCRGQTFSLSDRKEFADTAGRPLFSLRTKLLSIHKCFYAEAPGGEVLFEVKGKFSRIERERGMEGIIVLMMNENELVGTSKMVATFQNAANGAPVELLVKGDWLDRSATITMGNVVVAQISRSYFNMREMVGGQQSYYVTVAPNVDLALMAAICVCLDEKENEKK
ncbi:Protein LURP-one-related [Lachnellula occidentalis]|uniref:Protein LURP-one-related n=1 Tax=Lachnellula occidentalis TaxID=215460 RepID=A0A8H8U732_9HELO|nr:Protein LURP-one-related [Lachnellula occidentalis]